MNQNYLSQKIIQYQILYNGMAYYYGVQGDRISQLYPAWKVMLHVNHGRNLRTFVPPPFPKILHSLVVYVKPPFIGMPHGLGKEGAQKISHYWGGVSWDDRNMWVFNDIAMENFTKIWLTLVFKRKYTSHLLHLIRDARVFDNSIVLFQLFPFPMLQLTYQHEDWCDLNKWWKLVLMMQSVMKSQRWWNHSVCLDFKPFMLTPLSAWMSTYFWVMWTKNAQITIPHQKVLLK